MRSIAYTNVSIGLCSIAVFLAGIGAVIGASFWLDWRADRSFDNAPQVVGTIQELTKHCWHVKGGQRCRDVPLISYRRLNEHGRARQTFNAEHYPFGRTHKLNLAGLVGTTVNVRYHSSEPATERTTATVVEWPAARMPRAFWAIASLILSAAAFFAALWLSPATLLLGRLRDALSDAWARAALR